MNVFVSNALMGLREGLEAALVVVILVAFLVKVGRREALRYVAYGVGVAVGLSVALGALLTYGTARLSFEAQEMVGGFSSLIAVAFVTSMVLWMRTAARTISGQLKGKLSRALEVGPWAVAAVAFLGVGREGLETAIFFYATVHAAQTGSVWPLLGWAVGLASAVVLGVLIYRGAIRLNLSAFFTVTGVALIVVAAGILSYGIHDLQEAAVLPGLHSLAFDLSHIINPSAWYAVLLKGLFNFTPATTVLQAIAWLSYTAIVITLFLRPVRSQPAAASAAPAASAPPAATQHHLVTSSSR